MNLRIGSKQLKRVENCNYLGIYFDYNLRWNIQAEHIVKKTKYQNFLFHKIKNLMPQNPNALRVLYFLFEVYEYNSSV